MTWCPTHQPLPILHPQKVFVGVTQAASSEGTSGGAQKRNDQYLPRLGPGPRAGKREGVHVAGQPPSDFEPCVAQNPNHHQQSTGVEKHQG